MYSQKRIQGSVLHVWQNVSSPGQSMPPLAGAGLVQVLERVWMPPSQGMEQSSNGDHSVHCPLTESNQNKQMSCKPKSISSYPLPHFLGSYLDRELFHKSGSPLHLHCNPFLLMTVADWSKYGSAIEFHLHKWPNKSQMHSILTTSHLLKLKVSLCK